MAKRLTNKTVAPPLWGRSDFPGLRQQTGTGNPGEGYTAPAYPSPCFSKLAAARKEKQPSPTRGEGTKPRLPIAVQLQCDAPPFATQSVGASLSAKRSAIHSTARLALTLAMTSWVAPGTEKKRTSTP